MNAILPGNKELPVHVEKNYRTTRGDWSGLSKAHPNITQEILNFIEREYRKLSFRKVKLTDWEKENFQAPEGFQPVDIELEAVRQLYGTDSKEYEQAIVRTRLEEGVPIFDRDIEEERKKELLRRHFGELDCYWNTMERREIRRRERQVALSGDYEPDWQFEMDDNCNPLTKPSQRNKTKFWFDPWKEPDKFNLWLKGKDPFQTSIKRKSNKKDKDPDYVAREYDWSVLVQLEEFKYWKIYNDEKEDMKIYAASLREARNPAFSSSLYKFLNDVKEDIDKCKETVIIRGLNQLPWGDFSVICMVEIPSEMKSNNPHIFSTRTGKRAKYFRFEVIGNPFVIQNLIEEMNNRLKSYRKAFYDYSKSDTSKDVFLYRMWEEFGNVTCITGFPKKYRPKCKVCGELIPALRLAHAKWTIGQGIKGSDIQDPCNSLVHKCIRKLAQSCLEYTVCIYKKDNKFYTKARLPYSYHLLIQQGKNPENYGWKVYQMIRRKNYKTGKFYYEKPTVKHIKVVHCDGSDVQLVTNSDITG